jgi:hypothetical protein
VYTTNSVIAKESQRQQHSFVTMEKYFPALKKARHQPLRHLPVKEIPWLTQPSVDLPVQDDAPEQESPEEAAPEHDQEGQEFNVTAVAFLGVRHDGESDVCAVWGDGTATREDANSFGTSPHSERMVSRCALLIVLG